MTNVGIRIVANQVSFLLKQGKTFDEAILAVSKNYPEVERLLPDYRREVGRLLGRRPKKQKTPQLSFRLYGGR